MTKQKMITTIAEETIYNANQMLYCFDIQQFKPCIERYYMYLESRYILGLIGGQTAIDSLDKSIDHDFIIEINNRALKELEI